MSTVIRPDEKRRKPRSTSKAHRRGRGSSLSLFEDMPLALSRSSSLDTLATGIPRRIRLAPVSGPRPKASVGIELPEGTVARLLVMNEQSDVIETLIDGWLPAGTHELCDLCLPNGAYRLRLETPNAWHVAGLMIG